MRVIGLNFIGVILSVVFLNLVFGTYTTFFSLGKRSFCTGLLVLELDWLFDLKTFEDFDSDGEEYLLLPMMDVNL